jgi:hypothetical protein
MWTQLQLPFINLPIIRSIDPPTYWRRYQAYLRSSFWKWVRKQTFERADYLCQIRAPGCTEIATECHHTTYLLWNGSGDIAGKSTVASCSHCHRYVHSHPQMLPDFDPANDNLPNPYRKREIV